MSFPAQYIDAPPPLYISTLVDDRFPTEKRNSFFNLFGIEKKMHDAEASWQQFESIIVNSVAEDRPLKDLARLIVDIRNDRDEESPPTDYAVSQTISLVETSAMLLAQRWKLPRLATDGYGGLRLSWKENNRELRAVVTASREKERYLYWEDPGGYGSISNFTAITLFSYLDSLLGGKDFARIATGSTAKSPRA
jgi:hypothetical protein